jgi:RNA polymerase sigma factor (sigma-70 family)
MELTASRQVDGLSDGDLVAAASSNDAAVSELYRRHVQAAWGVAQAVTGNHDDAADAVAEAFASVLRSLADVRPSEFRPYLMAATRNAAIDIVRRTARVMVTDDVGAFEAPTADPGPVDSLVGGENATLVRQAFAGLPERWRSVLWLVEVERVPPRDVAEIVGTSANNVAQIAARARSRLRERYAQSHVRNHAASRCDFTVNNLGAYFNNGLTPGHVAKVDEHLENCRLCRDRLAELRDLGLPLRASMIALPAALRLATGDRLDSAKGALTAIRDPGVSATALRPDWPAATARGFHRFRPRPGRSPLGAVNIVTSPLVGSVAESPAVQWLVKASASLLVAGVSVVSIVSSSPGGGAGPQSNQTAMSVEGWPSSPTALPGPVGVGGEPHRPAASGSSSATGNGPSPATTAGASSSPTSSATAPALSDGLGELNHPLALLSDATAAVPATTSVTLPALPPDVTAAVIAPVGPLSVPPVPPDLTTSVTVPPGLLSTPPVLSDLTAGPSVPPVR